MKPFESPEGQPGVVFEGAHEIGALALGLNCLVELAGTQSTQQGRDTVDDITTMRDTAVNTLLGALGRDAEGEQPSTTTLPIAGPQQLKIAEVALEATRLSKNGEIQSFGADTSLRLVTSFTEALKQSLLKQRKQD